MIEYWKQRWNLDIGFITEYWWLYIILAVVYVLVFLFMKGRD